MRRHRTVGWVGAILAAVFLAGCSVGTGAGPTAAPSGSAGAASTGVAFTGREPRSGAETESGDVTVFDSARTASDPRMSGSMHVTLYVDETGSPVRIWGLYDLSNDEGQWGCQWAGLRWADNYMIVRDDVCVGKGAFSGQMAYVHATSYDGGESFGVTGWIDENAY